MKKVLAFLAFAVGLLACDIIPENDRIKPFEPVETQQRVLLTEFTGMKCVNCPRAAELAHSLLETYPDNFVVVAMHPASNHFTTPEDPLYDLRCEEADEYYKYFGGAPSTVWVSVRRWLATRFLQETAACRTRLSACCSLPSSAAH